MGAIVTLAMNAEPSLRMRNPCVSWRPLSRADWRSRSKPRVSVPSRRYRMAAERPSASPALHPKISSAPLFQLAMFPCASSTRSAVSVIALMRSSAAMPGERGRSVSKPVSVTCPTRCDTQHSSLRPGSNISKLNLSACSAPHATQSPAAVSEETLFLRVAECGAAFFRVNCCPRSILSCQICSDLYIGATSVCCVRASGFGPGWFFPTGRGFQAIRVFGSGAWSGLCRALSRVSGSGFAMSGLPVRRGRTVARAPLALFHRQRLPGLSGPAARSTQEQRCFCERDDFASTCSMRRSTSGQLQKTVLNPVDSGRMRA